MSVSQSKLSDSSGNFARNVLIFLPVLTPDRMLWKKIFLQCNTVQCQKYYYLLVSAAKHFLLKPNFFFFILRPILIWEAVPSLSSFTIQNFKVSFIHCFYKAWQNVASKSEYGAKNSCKTRKVFLRKMQAQHAHASSGWNRQNGRKEKPWNLNEPWVLTTYISFLSLIFQHLPHAYSKTISRKHCRKQLRMIFWKQHTVFVEEIFYSFVLSNMHRFFYQSVVNMSLSEFLEALISSLYLCVLLNRQVSSFQRNFRGTNSECPSVDGRLQSVLWTILKTFHEWLSNIYLKTLTFVESGTLD